MKLFSQLYAKVMNWARHRHAQYYLGALSFAESSFFPVPPDVMLMPMALAKPNQAINYATLTTITSVLGGLFGYFIGYWAFQTIAYPMIIASGHQMEYQQILAWFDVWGIWVIFVAGFSPIPYKLFTITAGALNMAFLPFILASFIARGARFYLVALIMRHGGERAEQLLHQWADRVGWSVVLLAVVAYAYTVWIA